MVLLGPAVFLMFLCLLGVCISDKRVWLRLLWPWYQVRLNLGFLYLLGELTLLFVQRVSLYLF